MKKSKGSNLVEYIIPIALIAVIVGVTIFAISDNNSLMGFASKSGNMTVKKNTAIINEQGDHNNLLNPSAGSLGGKLSKPASECKDGKCTIDYGNYIFSQIPEKFEDFVKTSGSAGAIKQVATYFESIAKGIKESGSTDMANEIQKLSILGHNIALVMGEYERIFNDCNGDSVCLAAYNDMPFPMPEGYNDLLMPFPSGLTYKELIDSGSFGSALNSKNQSPLATAYVEQYNKIKGLSTLDNSTKGVIEELSWSIGTIGQDFEYNFQGMLGNNVSYYDPISGQSTNPSTSSYHYPADKFMYYDSSKNTHFYSSLICGAGKGQSTGTTCH